MAMTALPLEITAISRESSKVKQVMTLFGFREPAWLVEILMAGQVLIRLILIMEQSVVLLMEERMMIFLFLQGQ